MGIYTKNISSIVILLFMMVNAFILNSCATLGQIIQKPKATFAEIQMTDADLLHADAVFTFNVDNPNAINIRASRITYDLKLNGRNLVAGKLDQGMTLVAKSTSQLKIPVTMRYLDLFDSVTQLWQTKSASYALTGGFSVGPFRIPIQARGDFELPKKPKISLNAIKIENFSLQGARLNCELTVDNPNRFDLLFKRLEYNLNLGGTSIAHASTKPQRPMARNSKSEMVFSVDVNFAQLGMSAYHILAGDKGDFELDGAMIMDSSKGRESIVPFQLAGQVPLLR